MKKISNDITTPLESSRYEYRKLEEGEIRLLRLYPGSEAEPLQASLEHVPEDDATEYQAISYAWGEPIFDCRIYLDGQYLEITKSLYDALHRFRMEDEAVILWADAVCINQSDHIEKSEQVKIMARIFNKAYEVLVWVGEAGPELKPLCDLIKMVSEDDGTLKNLPKLRFRAKMRKYAVRQISRIRSRHSPTEDNLPLGIDGLEIMRRFHGLEAFCNRPWFGRLWVIQEAAKAEELTFVCGEYEFSAYALRLAIKYYCDRKRMGDYLHTGDKIRRAAYLLTVEDAAVRETKQAEHWLLDTLTKCWDFKCSDARDRIFSLRAIHDAISSVYMFRPDYGMQVEELWRQLSIFFMTTPRDTWIKPFIIAMPGTQRGKGSRQLASWIPDFAALSSQTRKKQLLYESSLRIRQAGGKQEFTPNFEVSSLDALNQNYGTVDTRTFVIPGVLLSRVTAILPDSQCPIADIQAIDDDAEYMEAIRCVLHPWYIECRQFSREWMIGKKEYEFSIMLWQGIFEGTEEYESRQLLSRLAEFNATVKNLRSYAVWHQLDSKQIVEDLWNIQDEWKGYAVLLDTTKVLGLTSNAYMGWSNGDLEVEEAGAVERVGWIPEVAKVGDIVCLLQGAPFPFVLRPDNDGYYEIIGDAYVHGVMHGEAWPEDDEDVDEIRIR